MKILWVNTGIVATLLFKIDVPSSSKCIRFGTELPRPNCMTRLKAERYSDHLAWCHMRILVVEKYFKFS